MIITKNILPAWLQCHFSNASMMQHRKERENININLAISYIRSKQIKQAQSRFHVTR